jgi:hypothetical protein
MKDKGSIALTDYFQYKNKTVKAPLPSVDFILHPF